MIKASQLGHYDDYCMIISQALRCAFANIEKHYSWQYEMIAEKQGATLQRIMNDPMDFANIHCWMEDTDWLTPEESSSLIDRFIQITDEFDPTDATELFGE